MPQNFKKSNQQFKTKANTFIKKKKCLPGYFH